MHYTLETLIHQPETDLREYYGAAVEHWKGLLKKHAEVETLAEALSTDQISFFEKQCGGRYQGQEIMAFAGLGLHYRTIDGFGDRKPVAQLAFDAMMRSHCSSEVKWHARSAARELGLED